MSDAGLQKYIPLSRAALERKLLSDPIVPDEFREGLERVARMLEAIWHHRLHAEQEELKQAYEALDPDNDPTGSSQDVQAFLECLEPTLRAGNWEPISQAELTQALNSEAVFPISLKVYFDEFERMRLYKLGQTRQVVTQKSLLGLREFEHEVDVYDRVIQLLEFKSEAWFQANKRAKKYPGDGARGLNMRLFKRVPKADLETLFPNTSPNMRTLDKIKIASPIVGGIVTLLIKFGPTLAFLLFGLGSGEQGKMSLALLGGVLSGLATYMVKAYLSYRGTKDKYLSQVSKDLYFKGQANNSAVINAVIDLTEEQEVKEALLAYTFLLVDRGVGHTIGTLDERIERWLAEQGVEVDFEVDDALGKLHELGLLDVMPATSGPPLASADWIGPDSKLDVEDVDEALRILDRRWDTIFSYAS